jgi:hypothetical protein
MNPSLRRRPAAWAAWAGALVVAVALVVASWPAVVFLVGVWPWLVGAGFVVGATGILVWRAWRRSRRW